MKKYFFILSLLIISSICKAQNSQINKSVTGLQIGLFGVDFYNESRLSNELALRSELSLFPAVWGEDLYTKIGVAFYPAITLQPKYYYNLSSRIEKGRNTKNNSANYLAVQFRYIPNWFVISNKDVEIRNQIHVIPTFGIRRNFAENFNYEFKAGLGYGTTFGYDQNQSGAVIDLTLKLGFDF